MMEGSDDLWQFDSQQGVLTFNIRHPTWVACAERDLTVMQLQEYVAIQALTLYSVPTDWFEIVKVSFGELISPFAFLLKSGALSRTRS